MEKKGVPARFLSGIYLLGALILLLWVCGNCCPQLRRVITGMEDSPLRQAFGVLSEGLESGVPVRDTVERTVQVFFEAD